VKGYKVILCLPFSLCSLVASSDHVLAQPNLSPVDPSRIEREFKDVKPKLRPEPLPLPSPPKEIGEPQLNNLRFVLQGVNVRGNQVLGREISELLEENISNLLGQEVSFEVIQNLADSIEELYRKNDYVFVKVVIPPQDFSTGDIVLDIVEGFIESYEFIKATPGQINRLKGYLENIIGKKPIKLSEIQRNLILMNELAGYQVRGNLRRGQKRGGTILSVEVQQTPANGFIQVDNWASDSVGPGRLQAGVILNSLGDQGERIFISGATALFDVEELQSLQLGFQIPINFSGLKLNSSAVYTKTQPGGLLKPFEIKGEAFRFSIGLSYPIIRSITTDLDARIDFNLTNSSSIFGVIDPPVFLYVDRIRALELGLNFRKRHSFGSISGGIQFSQGLDILGARNKGTLRVPISNQFGKTDAFRVNFNLNQFWQLPSNFGLNISLASQISNKPLVVSEQFSYGGSFIGSAYNPSQIIGDNGFIVRGELLNNINQGRVIWQPYVFADYGKVSLQKASTPELQTQELASAGLGLRLQVGNKINFRLEAANPLKSIAEFTEGKPVFRFSVQSLL